MIHVVEDDAGVRELELYALRQAGFDAQGFSEPREFRAALEKALPDAVILDVMLPGENGINVLRSLRQDARTRRIPVILVTARDTEMDKVRGLDEGADDYLTKPFGVMELISRVKALLRRCEDAEDEKFYSVRELRLDVEKHSVSVEGESIELTFKEYELLRLLMQNAGIVTSREVIMERVWGTDFEGESRTLDMHIKTLRQKLGEAGSLIKTIRNVGYIIE